MKLLGYGHRPWFEFELDPGTGAYSKRRIPEPPKSMVGYLGLAQELRTAGHGKILWAAFVLDGDVRLTIGKANWPLCESGLKISHSEGTFSSEMELTEPGGRTLKYRYRRSDLLLFIIDSTYDNLDDELANLPAALPDLSKRKRDELVALWSRRAAAA